jgi:hypothetical protein
MTVQRAVTELACGYAWSRPGLDQRTRSILMMGILAGLGRFRELGIYTNAALNSGVTVGRANRSSSAGHGLLRNACGPTGISCRPRRSEVGWVKLINETRIMMTARFSPDRRGDQMRRRSVGRPPARDVEDRSGAERARVRAQPQDKLRNLSKVPSRFIGLAAPPGPPPARCGKHLACRSAGRSARVFLVNATRTSLSSSASKWECPKLTRTWPVT